MLDSDEDHETVERLRAAAVAGDADAACRLGDRCRQGNGVSQNFGEALRWYELGAAGGDADAQNNLGSMLLNGLGCDRDPLKATSLYRLAADQGHAVAQYNLAKRYLHGDGPAQDEEEAFRWMRAAAGQLHVEALCDLGTMFIEGRGRERNPVAAASFHILACERGDDKAGAVIASYLEELQSIALGGNVTAALRLCTIHNRGYGTPASQALTWTWIKWAKEHCAPPEHPDDIEGLREMYGFYSQYMPSGIQMQGNKVVHALAATPPRRHVLPACGVDADNRHRRTQPSGRTCLVRPAEGGCVPAKVCLLSRQTRDDIRLFLHRLRRHIWRPPWITGA